MEQIKNSTPVENTLSKKYFYKLSSNVIAIFAGICTSAIVPRALGVSTYGDFSFVNNIVTQILSFLDLRASTCFYVKLSQRQSDSRIITFYGIYLVLIFVLLTITITVLVTGSFFFEEIHPSIVWYAVLLVAAKWLADIFIKISDAYGTTVFVERIKMFNQILSVGVLLLLFLLGLINVSTFYWQQILMFTLLSFLIYAFFRKRNYAVPLISSMDKRTFVNYGKEFYSFSSPLAVFLTATLITEVFDRSVLQHHGGSYQQGLFGFSFSMSNMTILFVTAMVPLFTRELSIAFSLNDNALALSLYRRYVPVIYVVSSYFCCFLFVNAEDVVLLFGGEQYIEATLPLRIMFLYPLASTYSNLNGSVITAGSDTRILRNMTLVVSPFGMLVTYALVSSRLLDWGAAGLAVKMLATELIGVTITTLHISSYLRFNLLRFFMHMIFVPCVLILLAYGIRTLLLSLFDMADGNIFVFLTTGFIYSGLLALIIYIFPLFVGLKKENIEALLVKFKSVGAGSQ